MTVINHQDRAIEKLCSQAIDGRLGDISGLPENLKKYVNRVYREFVSSYLNILRQSEGKPSDWIPETLLIDPELTDGMRHFYSDYQHITKRFYRLNQKLDRLQQTDKDRQLKLYQNIIDDILQEDHGQTEPGDGYEGRD